MNNYYKVLLNPSKENLKKHNIKCFDTVISSYDKHYEKIISFINECYNFQSPYLVEEKDWGVFLSERFEANGLSDYQRADIIHLQNVEVALAIDCYLTLQEDVQFHTLVTKQNLRQQMIAYINTGTYSPDKKGANELLSQLDEEITRIHEAMRQDQRLLGNGKGYDAVKKAKVLTVINIANI